MQKFKSLKFSSLMGLLKCCLIGVISTLIGIVIFAVILKFADISSVVISNINNIIKSFSIFIMLTCVKRSTENRFFIKSIIAGGLYALLTFLVFSILNGTFVIGLSFLYDFVFAVVVSMIISVIINILNRSRT